MKISKITVRPVTIRYKRDFNTAYGPERETCHAIAEVMSDTGMVGLGEAAPLTDFTGESYQTVEAMFHGKFKHILLNSNPFDHALIHERLEAIKGNPAAKAAVDIALYDLMGKELGVPVFKLIGGRFRNRVEAAEAIGIDSPERMAEVASDLKRQGFKTIKMKVGSGRLADDAERVAAVRNALGSQVDLRVDPNNSYTVDRAMQFGRKIKRFDLAYLEQPVAAKNVKGMAKVRRTLGIPIAADEAVHNSEDALRVIKYEAADILVIKFAKCGGICEAKVIASLAKAAGLKCVLVSAFEIGIGIAANLHVACSSPSIELPCEIAIGPCYNDEFTQGLENHLTWINVPEAHGLGVNLV